MYVSNGRTFLVALAQAFGLGFVWHVRSETSGSELDDGTCASLIFEIMLNALHIKGHTPSRSTDPHHSTSQRVLVEVELRYQIREQI